MRLHRQLIHKSAGAVAEGNNMMLRPHLVLLLLVSLLFASPHEAQALTMNTTTSADNALYVFGDSTVDPGNNNYLKTLFKSNFSPYGRDFLNHVPTGRFTNGRLATDFIASYAGVKNYVPPYLDPTLSVEELMTGFSIASAGSGFDPLTPTLTNVIDMPKQLEYFREYKKRLESKIGKKRSEKRINTATYLVSAGTNDFVVNYFLLPVRRTTYSVSAYQRFLVQHVKQFIQGLWNEGARKIAVVGLPPIGCLPMVTTLLSDDQQSLPYDCVEKYSRVAQEYNQILQSELALLQTNFQNLNSRIYYVDIYNSLSNMIDMKQHYGFEDVSSGCCGTGYVEAGPLCNPKTFVCSDASKYVFWDSIHPTERAYYNIFLAARPIIDLIIKGRKI